MESPQFIRAKLVNYTNADCSSQEVKNNRYHYYLRFDSDRGWEWLDQQIEKLSAELSVSLEPYNIKPSGMQDYEVEVRELARRANIDDSQRGLSDF